MAKQRDGFNFITFVQFYLVFGLDNSTSSTPMPAVEPTCETCEEIRKEMKECKELLQAKLHDAEERHKEEVKQLQHAFAKEKARLLKQATYLEKKIDAYKQKANEETERCKRQLFGNKAGCQQLTKRPRTSIVAETFGSMIGKYTRMNKKLKYIDWYGTFDFLFQSPNQKRTRKILIHPT